MEVERASSGAAWDCAVYRGARPWHGVDSSCRGTRTAFCSFSPPEMMKHVCLGVILLQVLSCTADIDPGKIGLEFFGNEFAYTEQTVDFPTTDLSLTLRIKAKSGTILSYGKDQGGAWDSQLALSNAASLKISRGATSVWETGANFADNAWHALAITFKMSTGELKLYKDGVLVDTNQMSQGVPFSVDGHLVVGKGQACPIGCFTDGEGLVGVIADVTLWRKVLTAQQVEYLSTNAPSGDESDVVSFWPLFENDSLLGKDKTGIHDLLIGGPSWVTDVGLQGSAASLSLHKTGAVLLTPSNDMPTGDFTIEFWIKSTALEDSRLISFFDEATGTYPFEIHNPGLIQVIRNGATLSTDTSLVNGVWNHAAITWTQSTGRLKMYKNGALTFPPAWLPEADYDNMPTFDLNGALDARPDRVVLGGQVNCASGSCLIGSGFDGQLQDVRIWSTVRSQVEIEQWRENVLPLEPLPENLEVYWMLDEKTTSRTAADSAGRGNDGQLTRPAWVNTLIAPPFPTLEDVNQKVAGLKEQMTDLLDFVKEVMEPELKQVNETAFAVEDEGKCDRRYKYLCTYKANPVVEEGGEAGGEGGGAARARAAAGKASSMLVQRALSRSSLSEQLTPTLQHRLSPIKHGAMVQRSVAGKTAKKSVGAAPHTDKATVTESHERRVGGPKPIGSGQPLKSSHKRHLWATGSPAAHEATTAPVVELLQEEEQVGSRDFDDGQPELKALRGASHSRQGEDYLAVQERFESRRDGVSSRGLQSALQLDEQADGSNSGHHHHHHHKHHHEQQAPHQQAPQQQAPPQKLVSRKDLVAAEQQKQKAVGEGVGGKFEQLVMAGQESEWDEAIAAGVGNSDLANDDVSPQSV